MFEPVTDGVEFDTWLRQRRVLAPSRPLSVAPGVTCVGGSFQGFPRLTSLMKVMLHAV